MPKPPRPHARLRCEALETRDVPATFYPRTASELVAAVATATASAGADTVVLATGATYTLTVADNTTFGPTGLPVVTKAGGALTVVGNGATVERSTATSTPSFRLIAVEPGATLTAENLTLQNGRIEFGITVFGSSAAAGGALLNQGTVVLRNVTIQNNVAAGTSGVPAAPFGGVAAGGGVYSNGSLTITGGSIRNNQTLGGDSARGMDGAPGLGGGVYVGGGTASLTGVTLADNVAGGGAGGEGYWFYPSRGKRRRIPPGDGGSGAGGGLYARTAVVTLASCTVTGNQARGGSGGGKGYGGGIYVGYEAAVDWDSATHFSRNRAGTSGDDFYRE